MGVINNLIEIRRKFRAIVGANWNGATISDILNDRPHIAFEVQPTDTTEDSVTIRVNVYGFTRQLQRLSNDGWVSVGATSGTTGVAATQSLSGITETSVCRIIVTPYGGNLKAGVISNEFTVTRTEAQTVSASPKSKGADIFTESEADSIDVVKENIEKE